MAWAAAVTNQWLPLVPGVVMEYECDTDEGLEGTVVEVLPDVRVVDGARPGIILGADPGAHPGEAYRQEYDEGEAEDFGRALDLGNDVVVPWDTSAGCLRTEDWNALEPGGREHKYYCPGVGLVREADAALGERAGELVSVTGP